MDTIWALTYDQDRPRNSKSITPQIGGKLGKSVPVQRPYGLSRERLPPFLTTYCLASGFTCLKIFREDDDQSKAQIRIKTRISNLAGKSLIEHDSPECYNPVERFQSNLIFLQSTFPDQNKQQNNLYSFLLTNKFSTNQSLNKGKKLTKLRGKGKWKSDVWGIINFTLTLTEVMSLTFGQNKCS